MNAPSLLNEGLRSKATELTYLEAELDRKVKSNPLAFYWPHAKGCDGTKCKTVKQQCKDSFGTEYEIEGCPQYAFHISEAETRAFFGSNRSGKTTAGVVECPGFAATGIYPQWYPMKRRYSRPTKGRVLANDFKKAVGEVITEAIDDWIPRSLILHKSRNSMGIFDKYWIQHVSGGVSTFDIITYEQDSSVAEGWNGDWAWYDEPPPRGHRIATARGLVDRLGWEIFTLTPLKEPWLFDELWSAGNFGGQNNQCIV